MSICRSISAIRIQKRDVEDRGNPSREDFSEEVVLASDFKTKEVR